MNFTESVITCLSKYVTFSGRASRSEYWWFIFFCSICSVALNFISTTLQTFFVLLVVLPMLAAACRRLHDSGKSGWWLLFYLVPLIGWIVLLIFLVRPSKERIEVRPRENETAGEGNEQSDSIRRFRKLD